MLRVTVRSPTGRAWLLFAVPFILAGELFFELRKHEPSTLFNIPFTDGELLVWSVVFGTTAIAGLTWLLRLYFFPGSLQLDPEGQTLERFVPGAIGSRVVRAPCTEWDVHISYFNEEQRAAGVFKRIELSGPGLHEVLLFGDCRPAATLANALEAQQTAWRKLEVHLERS